MMNNGTDITINAPVIGVARHRLATDGNGVTTLVAFHGCPLRCKYCLNPHSLVRPEKARLYSPESLYDETRIDELYFIATGGGVTFGGGEPCMRSEFIIRFRELCGPQWRLTLETSLNVPIGNIEMLLPVIDGFIIDIKDMNRQVYERYTGMDSTRVIDNLRYIAEKGRAGDCVVRIPLIPGYNTEADRESSQRELETMGYSRFDLFTYKT